MNRKDIVKELVKMCGLSEKEILRKWRQAELLVLAQGIKEDTDDYYPMVYNTFKRIAHLRPSQRILTNENISVREVLLDENPFNSSFNSRGISRYSFNRAKS